MFIKDKVKNEVKVVECEEKCSAENSNTQEWQNNKKQW